MALSSTIGPGSGGGVIPVRVAIRVRPLVKKEEDEGADWCTRCEETQNEITIGEKVFSFNYVFGPSSSQESLYEAVAQPLTDQLFKGYNCTVFAYGQTGSGKTFTMGTEETEGTCGTESAGIIPRIVDSIFSRVEEETGDFSFLLKCSMLEIYEEKVYDLFGDTRTEKILRELNNEVYVQGLSEMCVGSQRETMSQLEKGCHLRSKAQTAMNTQSSRSHAIFTLFLYKTDLKDETNSCQAKLHLVDLAGSERLAKTQAEGQRMKEGIKINGGLLALGNVIQKLSENQPHINYRDSKLTRLLSDSLGGNSYTVMIACASPADSNFDETMSTLRYAERAMKIKNRPTVNKDPKAAEIAALRMKVQRLEHDLLLYKTGKEASSTTSPHFSPADLAEMEALRRENAALRVDKARLTDRVAELGMDTVRCLDAAMTNEKEKEALSQRLATTADTIRGVIEAGEDADLSEDSRGRMLGVLRGILEDLASPVHTPEPEDDLAKTEDVSGGDESSEEDGEGVDEEGGADVFVKKQSVIGEQISDIMRQIRDKETLVTQTVSTQEEMELLRIDHEKQMKDFMEKIRHLEHQKEELNRELRKKDNFAKLSEERRRRLAETEKQLGDYRKKVQELQRLQKINAQSDTNIRRLREEILGLKQLRVKLMKELRSETEKYRKWKNGFEKEMTQMKQKERKREFEARKTKQKFDQTLAVYKRKYEEALSFGNRMKQKLETQRGAGQAKLDESKASESVLRQIRGYLERELTALGTIEEAEMHLKNLLEQRKELNHQFKAAQRKLERLSDQPPAKKRSMGGGRSEESDDNKEGLMEELQKEMNGLKTEIRLRTNEINKIQSEITTFDLEKKGRQRWSTIHTLVQAKLYLQELFSMAVGSKTELLKRTEEYEESQGKVNSLESSLKKGKTQTELQRRRVERQQSALVEALDKEKALHQSEVCTVLRMLGGVMGGKELTGEDVRRMEEMSSRLEEKETLLELLRKKDEEKEELHNELCMEKVKRPSSRKFFKPVVASLDEEEEEEEASISMKRSRSSRLLVVPKRYGNNKDPTKEVPVEDGEEWSGGEGDDDDSYHETPLNKRVKKITNQVVEQRKRSDLFGVGSGCGCKGGCGTGRCGCRKQGSFCDSLCSCKACVNRDTLQGDDENRSASSENTFTLPQTKLDATYSANKGGGEEVLNDTFDVKRGVGRELKGNHSGDEGSPILNMGINSFQAKMKSGRTSKFFPPVTPNP